jgi:hypothetical protein
MTRYDNLWREGKEYPDASCPDAPGPPHFPILKYDHDEETHVKQSRHPSTVARAYYCFPYKSVSNSSHVWILFDLTLTSFYSYESRIGADSFSGSMDPRCLIQKFFFPHMKWVSLIHCNLSSIGFLHHRIPPPMIDELKAEATTRRVRHPPPCKCGYRSELANPPPGLDYTPFFHCSIHVSVILYILVLFNNF